MAITAIALFLTLIAGSSAIAYWTTTGEGGGTGTTGATLPLTMSAATPTAQLYPGGQGNVGVTIDNPNAFSVRVGSFSLSLGQGTAGFGVDAGHAGCPTSVLSFTAQTNGGAGWSVPAKVGFTNGSLSLDLPGAIAMSASAPNTCQGATFDVFLSAGP